VLTLGFLGQRAYLQGTTPLNALADRLTDAHSIHFQCRKVIFSDRVAVRSGVGPLPEPSHWHAWLTWHDARGGRWIGIEPEAPSAEPAREPYDESQLTRLATLDADAVSLAVESPFPFVSTLVSLNKFLLLSQPSERRSGQWLFTGLKVSRFPREFLPLRLKIRQVLAGIAARTTIFIADESLGEIEFVWFADNLHTAPAT
jgi:hypothetical protein